MGEVREKYPIGSWTVGGKPTVTFSVVSFRQSGGNRIAQHERPGRDGAKLDSTGNKPRVWNVTAYFNNTIEEGAEGGVVPYPNGLHALLRSFARGETGDLVLPPIGNARAKSGDYSWDETVEDDDAATLTLTWTEDNEDALDRAQLSPPSAGATLAKLSEQTKFSDQRAGMWNDDLVSLSEFAGQIEALILAPGRAASDLGAVVQAHRRSMLRVIEAMQQAAEDTDRPFAEPRGGEGHRQMLLMMDREARAESERFASRPRTTTYVVDVEQTSMFEIAGRLDQPVEDLLELNASRVGDPFSLERGQVIRVYESAR